MRRKTAIHGQTTLTRRRIMVKARNLCWLIAAVAIAGATIGLSALIIVFVPNDPNAAAAAAQQQVISPRHESMGEAHRRGK